MYPRYVNPMCTQLSTDNSRMESGERLTLYILHATLCLKPTPTITRDGSETERERERPIVVVLLRE